MQIFFITFQVWIMIGIYFFVAVFGVIVTAVFVDPIPSALVEGNKVHTLCHAWQCMLEILCFLVQNSPVYNSTNAHFRNCLTETCFTKYLVYNIMQIGCCFHSAWTQYILTLKWWVRYIPAMPGNNQMLYLSPTWFVKTLAFHFQNFMQL